MSTGTRNGATRIDESGEQDDEWESRGYDGLGLAVNPMARAHSPMVSLAGASPSTVNP